MQKQKYESSILIKVDKITKKKMREAKLNWSEEIRKFIKSGIIQKGNLARAVAGSDRILAISRKRKTGKKFDSTAFIRKMRETRYGPGSN